MSDTTDQDKNSKKAPARKSISVRPATYAVICERATAAGISRSEYIEQLIAADTKGA